jgi:hypothetical protein
MLASDVNNPEFVGAAHPDARTHVEFYWHAPIDKYESQKIGKEVRGPKMPFIRILNPGDRTSIIETFVTDYHKARFPQQWLAWQIKEGMMTGDVQIPGWSIDEWTELDQNQREELKFLKFTVVEQLAGATDAQVQKLGMGGIGLREKAKRALQARMGAETRDAIQKKDQEINELKDSITKLEALVKERLAAPGLPPAEVAPSDAPVAAPKRKGRPKGSKNKPKETE